MQHAWRPRLPTFSLLLMLALASPALQAQTPSDALAAANPASADPSLSLAPAVELKAVKPKAYDAHH